MLNLKIRRRSLMRSNLCQVIFFSTLFVLVLGPGSRRSSLAFEVKSC